MPGLAGVAVGSSSRFSCPIFSLLLPLKLEGPVILEDMVSLSSVSRDGNDSTWVGRTVSVDVGTLLGDAKCSVIDGISRGSASVDAALARAFAGSGFAMVPYIAPSGR